VDVLLVLHLAAETHEAIAKAEGWYSDSLMERIAKESGARVREPETNILLVDDRPQNLLALQSVLEPLQQNVFLAHSGDRLDIELAQVGEKKVSREELFKQDDSAAA